MTNDLLDTPLTISTFTSVVAQHQPTALSFRELRSILFERPAAANLPDLPVDDPGYIAAFRKTKLAQSVWSPTVFQEDNSAAKNTALTMGLLVYDFDGASPDEILSIKKTLSRYVAFGSTSFSHKHASKNKLECWRFAVLLERDLVLTQQSDRAALLALHLDSTLAVLDSTQLKSLDTGALHDYARKYFYGCAAHPQHFDTWVSGGTDTVKIPKITKGDRYWDRALDPTNRQTGAAGLLPIEVQERCLNLLDRDETLKAALGRIDRGTGARHALRLALAGALVKRGLADSSAATTTLVNLDPSHDVFDCRAAISTTLKKHSVGESYSTRTTNVPESIQQQIDAAWDRVDYQIQSFLMQKVEKSAESGATEDMLSHARTAASVSGMSVSNVLRQVLGEVSDLDVLVEGQALQKAEIRDYLGDRHSETKQKTVKAHVQALASVANELRYNKLKHQIEFRGEKYDEAAELDLFLLAEKKLGSSAQDSLLQKAVLQIARENAYDPVVDEIQALPAWDGRKRFGELAEKLSPQLTCDPAIKELYTTYLTYWAVAAIRRGLQPGTDFQAVLVLQGPEASGKSSFFRKIAGRLFSDQDINLSSPDAKQAMSSLWIHEWADLAVLSGKNADQIKAFITAVDDTYRAPYARTTSTFKRRAIFCGSVNNPYFLVSGHGDRRFWVIGKVNHVPLAWVEANRNQILAEALALHHAGQTVHLNDQQLAVARVHNSMFRSGETRSDTGNARKNELLEIIDEICAAKANTTITINQLLAEVRVISPDSRVDRASIEKVLRASGRIIKRSMGNTRVVLTPRYTGFDEYTKIPLVELNALEPRTRDQVLARLTMQGFVLTTTPTEQYYSHPDNQED